MAIQKFTSNLTMEGSTGSVRGKVPASLIRAMGGGHGDVIEFEVNGKHLVGGRIISGKEAQRIRSVRQDFGRAEAAPRAAVPAKSKAVAKSNGKGQKAKSQSLGKFVLAPPVPKAKSKVAKPSKQKTKVLMKPVAKKAQKGAKKMRFAL